VPPLSINQALSAVIMRQRGAGYPLIASMRQSHAYDLRALLEGLNPDRAAEARDAALLALGWAAALCRSDWIFGRVADDCEGGKGMLTADNTD
jgi:hypothetical protein